MNSQSKNIQFSLLKGQDMVKISEFEVTHRDLYSSGQGAERAPAKDGVLDRRLVGSLRGFQVLSAKPWILCRVYPIKAATVKHAVSLLQPASVIMHTSSWSCQSFTSAILNMSLLFSKTSAR
jgi:hypothetical protein